MSKTNISCIFKDGKRELEQGLNREMSWQKFPRVQEIPCTWGGMPVPWHRLEAKQLESSTGKDPWVLVGKLRAREQCTTVANINNQMLGKNMEK